MTPCQPYALHHLLATRNDFTLSSQLNMIRMPTEMYYQLWDGGLQKETSPPRCTKADIYETVIACWKLMLHPRCKPNGKACNSC